MRFVFFLLLPVLVLAQRPALAPTPVGTAARVVVPAPSHIGWSAGRPLAVADFQGRPDPGEPHAALTSATIDANGTCRNDVFTADVRARFDPATSWVREPGAITAALLRHEQLHFDIAELYARRLRLQLAAARPNCTQLQATFGRISQRLYAEWEREETRYDQETDHGLNAVQQEFWEQQTAVRLQQLAAYARPEEDS